jgi:hypothetical protein
MVQGSGFRVQGSGFRVQGSGFRVQGSEFKVEDHKLMLYGLGLCVEGLLLLFRVRVSSQADQVRTQTGRAFENRLLGNHL